MNLKTEKYILKIPNDITLVYCEKKNILLIKGPYTQKVFFSKLKIFINPYKKFIKISQLSVKNISNKERKKIKSLRGTTLALIKHKLIETSTIIHKKLKLHGVGYRIILENSLVNTNLLTFKLGYSHLIYFNLPKTLSVFYFNRTKFCIFGDIYQNINQTSAQIKSKKKPEPYKGKGILYENETIKLKEGKKV